MNISQAVTPLRMIFWGGLLCVFDFWFASTRSYNGGSPTGFRFDILNDLLGMILITVAVRRLSAFALDDAFRTRMQFIFICSVLGCVEAFMEHFVFERPVLVQILWMLVGIATLVATILFSTCMHRLSATYALPAAAASWLTTRRLVIFLWAVPLGLLQLAGLIALATGESFHYDVGPLVIPLLIIIMIPLVHLFVSTSRMQREAELAGGMPPSSEAGQE